MKNKKSLLLGSLLGLAVVAGLSVAIIGNQKKDQKINSIEGLLPRITIKELIKKSEGAVLGTVTAMDVVRDTTEGRIKGVDIVTNVTIDVEKSLLNRKKITGNEVTVQVMGGTIGNESVEVDGVSAFEVGQRVLVFLRPLPLHPGIYGVYGEQQGKFTVNNDGTLGAGSEREYFNDVFGKSTTLKELEQMISSEEK